MATSMLCAALFIAGIVEFDGAAGGDAAATTALTTYTLAPVADSYVTAAAPNTVWGSADQIQAANLPGHHKTAYLRFRLPNLGPAAFVGGQLLLTRTQHHMTGIVKLHTVADNTWQESRITQHNAPPVGRVVDSVQTNATLQTISLNVPIAALRGGAVSLALTSPSDSFVAFRSREWGVGGPRLKLSVSATDAPVPPPATPSSSPNPSSPTASASTSSSSAAATSSSAVQPSSSAGASSSSGQPPPSSSAAAPAPPPGTTSAAPPGRGCSVLAKLVPSCGYWWGIAPKAHTSTPRDVALAEDEQEAQTTFTVMHTYHENDQLFPTQQEREMALEPGKNRVLLINWKPATDMTWAAVANGAADARIDRLANYINATFPYPFFLAIWHEPENDLNQTPGSGMTASDYAAMFRHVVLRLRADGATSPVIVMDYMGFDNYALQGWFPQLWPGDDVVDWIGLDPYGSGSAGVYQSGDFSKLVNRKINGFAGYYSWATTNHPGKPIMLAEWGVNEGTNDPQGKARYLNSVSAELPDFPAIKALVYFDENIPSDPVAGSTTPDSSPQSLDAFRKLCDWAAARGPQPRYTSGNVEADH